MDSAPAEYKGYEVIKKTMQFYEKRIGGLLQMLKQQGKNVIEGTVVHKQQPLQLQKTTWAPYNNSAVLVWVDGKKG